MSIRKNLFYGVHRLVGSSFGRVYENYLEEDKRGVASGVVKHSLVRILNHCETHVPYYSNIMADIKQSYYEEPESYLQHLPILTKPLVRKHFEQLKSIDLPNRKWNYNTSGGSTGEPIKLIQDRSFTDHQMAVQLLSFQWTGRAVDEPIMYVWGSERDIIRGSTGLKTQIMNKLSNSSFLNAYRMTPNKMRSFIELISRDRPKLIVAYAQSIYELAKFVEQEEIHLMPQAAILTSSEVLHPFMREKIEAVFGCKVFDRYGSREVGDIACECREHAGLHVFPWTNYVEIVDDEGRPAPRNTEGNILVTCMTNFAMPLIRYAIGDRGVLSQDKTCKCGRKGQILTKILGRDTDRIIRRDGLTLDEGFFSTLLYYKDWVKKFQIVQKDYSWIVYNIVKSDTDYQAQELDEIRKGVKTIMGQDCKVEIRFVEEIPHLPSGKFRYLISEVSRDRRTPH